MAHPLHIRLVERIKTPRTGSPFHDIAWRIGGVIVFPIVLVLGLLLMAVLGLYAFVANVFAGQSNGTGHEAAAGDSNVGLEWTEFADLNGLKLFSASMGEIRFGPQYIALRSEPAITGLEGKFFGDWSFRTGNTLLLQQWNSTSTPDTNLVVLDPALRTVSTSVQSIPSVQWKMHKLNDVRYELVCDTGTETLKYHIRIET